MAKPNRDLQQAAKDARESEQFRAEIRAAHRPELATSTIEHRDEPPTPSPTLEAIMAMPHASDADKAKRLAAAERWLSQFVLRARFLSGKVDLRGEVRTNSKLTDTMELARRVLPDPLIQHALQYPASTNPTSPA